MRILFCNYEYPPLGGGGGVVMAALARQLARRHEVTVLTSRAGDLARARSDDQGVRVVRVPVFFRRQLAVANFPSMLAYLPSGFVRGLSLRRAAFDVINTHFVVPTGPLGHALARWHRLPNVLVGARRRPVRSEQALARRICMRRCERRCAGCSRR